MATVEFTCPECGQVCAFNDRHVGRRARCTKCNTYFLIPAAGRRACAIKFVETEDGPYSGFWPALLKDTPKALLHPAGLAAIAVMVALSVLRYYLGHPLFIVLLPILIFQMPFPLGMVITVLTTLSQCRYFFNIIQSAADQDDVLPPYLDGTYVDRFFDAIVSAYNFLFLAVFFLAPAGLIAFVLMRADLPARWPAAAAVAVGLFFLPLSMAIYAYSRDVLLSFRLNFVLRAARGAFWPHLVLYGQALAVAAVFAQSSVYAFKAPPETHQSGIACHALATVLIVLAARTAGVFYRHYGCYLP